MQLCVPSGSSLCVGDLVARSGGELVRSHPRASNGLLTVSSLLQPIPVVFTRADGALLAIRNSHQSKCRLGIVGLDKLMEYSGGSVPEDLVLFTMPHLSRKGHRTRVALYRGESTRHVQGARIVSEYPNLTARHLRERNIQAELVAVSGSAEALVVAGVADYGVSLVESGDSLRVNGLTVIEEILETGPVLLCRKDDSEALEVCKRLSCFLHGSTQ